MLYDLIQDSVCKISGEFFQQGFGPISDRGRDKDRETERQRDRERQRQRQRDRQNSEQ